MADILLLIGPNLNMLGTREPEIYGHQTLADIEKHCVDTAKDKNLSLELKQSNHEGELVEWIQAAISKSKFIIINAGAYTHTSVAIHDALKMFPGDIYEVHHSNPMSREEFRHTSYIAPLAKAIICGLGAKGYDIAIEAISDKF